jgi:hypothetical protein
MARAQRHRLLSDSHHPVVTADKHCGMLATPPGATVNDSQPTPRKREDYCECEVDELELQGGRVYLHLGARRDEPPRR